MPTPNFVRDFVARCTNLTQGSYRKLIEDVQAELRQAYYEVANGPFVPVVPSIPQPPLAGLNNWWKLEDYLDSIGTMDLTPTAGPVFVAGRVNNGAKFPTGTNSYLQVAPGPDLTTGDFSIVFWTKCNANQMILAFGDFAGIRQLDFTMIDGGTFETRVFDASGLDTTVDLQLDITAWNFICLRYDSLNFKFNISANGGGQVEIDVNGIQAPSSKMTLGMLPGFGAYAEDGMIDELGFYSRRITDDEVLKIFNMGVGSTTKYPSVIALQSTDGNWYNIRLVTINNVTYIEVDQDTTVAGPRAYYSLDLNGTAYKFSLITQDGYTTIDEPVVIADPSIAALGMSLGNVAHYIKMINFGGKVTYIVI